MEAIPYAWSASQRHDGLIAMENLAFNPKNVRRMYEVEPVAKRTRMVTKFIKVDVLGDDEKPTGKKRLERQDVEETIKGGFMVYFPKHHSIFVESEAQLHRLGITGESGFVDMATGTPVEHANVVSLKGEVERNTRRPAMQREFVASGDEVIDAAVNS